MGNSTSNGSKRNSKKNRSSKQLIQTDELDNEELDALKQVCISYIDQIEFVIQSVPSVEDVENGKADEPDFEEIFLQLKTFISSARIQLSRNYASTEIMIRNTNNETLIKSDANIHLTIEEKNIIEELELPTEKEIDDKYSPRWTSSTNFFTLDAYDTKLDSMSTNTSISLSNNSSLNVQKRSSSNGRRKPRKSSRTKYKKKCRFDDLPSEVWNKCLLHYFARGERFVLSTTCKNLLQICNINTFKFTDEFEKDNLYWRNNFFHLYVDTEDCFVLENNILDKFTHTQKLQLKYYFIYYNHFLRQKMIRKIQYEQQREKQIQIQNENEIEMKSCKKELKQSESTDDESDTDDEFNFDYRTEDDKHSISANDDLFGITDDLKEDPAAKLLPKEIEIEDNFMEEKEEDVEMDIVSISPALQMLEKFRSSFSITSDIQESVNLRISIPCEIEQIIVRNHRNKNGEVTKFIASILCSLPIVSMIDWFILENNNFNDRDVHRICAAILNRTELCNIRGLSFQNNTQITDKCISVLLKTVAKKCHRLQFLNLSNCSKLGNKTCSMITHFYESYAEFNIQLCRIDLENCGKINSKGVDILNSLFVDHKMMPLQVIVTFYLRGTSCKEMKAGWSKNLRFKRRRK